MKPFTNHRLFIATGLMLVSLASGCAQSGAPSAVAPASALMQAAGDDKAEAPDAALSSQLKRLFNAVFKKYDTDGDGVWKPKDFDLPEDRFLNLFHNYDKDDDRIVTREEYYPAKKHADMVETVFARAKVSGMGVGGRVSMDKAVFILDIYLQPYLNQDLRKKFIKKAFETSDKDDSRYLKDVELASAIAILEAKAAEKSIEKQVNRSKGQPDKPIGIN